MWLTTATAYGNSQRGDNYYLHTVSWQGNSYLIEFAYSTNWQYNVGDWAQVLTKSYAVYLPEDYDGWSLPPRRSRTTIKTVPNACSWTAFPPKPPSWTSTRWTPTAACISAFATKKGQLCERNAMILTRWALSG